MFFMDKKFGVLLVVLLVVSLFVISIQSASAAEFKDTKVGKLLLNVFWAESDGGDLTSDDMNTLGVITRWMMLLLVILLIYSGMSVAKFPQNSGLRFLLSLIIGFLAVVMINNSEFITLLQSYKALGLTISILLPMIALAFITYSVSISMNSFGILLQRLAWLIYSIFLFIKIGGMLLLKMWSSYVIFPSVDNVPTWMYRVVPFIFGKEYGDMGDIVSSMDTIVMVMLLVVTVAVFMWFVIMNEKTVRWIANATQVSDLDRYKDKVERSSGKVNVDAEATKK